MECKLIYNSLLYIFSDFTACRVKWTCFGHQMSNFSPTQTRHCFLSYFPSGGINLLVFCSLELSSVMCWPCIARLSSPLCLHWQNQLAEEQCPAHLWLSRKILFCTLHHCLLIHLVSSFIIYMIIYIIWKASKSSIHDTLLLYGELTLLWTFLVLHTSSHFFKTCLTQKKKLHHWPNHWLKGGCTMLKITDMRSLPISISCK